MSIRDQIVELALQLDAPDRAYVADLLEGSLQSERNPGSTMSKAWSDEINRRIEAYERDETTALTLEESIAEIRAELERHRQTSAVR